MEINITLTQILTGMFLLTILGLTPLIINELLNYYDHRHPASSYDQSEATYKPGDIVLFKGKQGLTYGFVYSTTDTTQVYKNHSGETYKTRKRMYSVFPEATQLPMGIYFTKCTIELESRDIVSTIKKH